MFVIVQSVNILISVRAYYLVVVINVMYDSRDPVSCNEFVLHYSHIPDLHLRSFQCTRC